MEDSAKKEVRSMGEESSSGFMRPWGEGESTLQPPFFNEMVLFEKGFCKGGRTQKGLERARGYKMMGDSRRGARVRVFDIGSEIHED